MNVKQDAVLPIGVGGRLSHRPPPEPADDYNSVDNGSPTFVYGLAVYSVTVFHTMCRIRERNESRCQRSEYTATNQYPVVQRKLLQQENQERTVFWSDVGTGQRTVLRILASSSSRRCARSGTIAMLPLA